MIVKLRQNFKKRREFSWIRSQKKIMLKIFIVYEIWLCSQMGTLAVFSTNFWNQFKVVYFDTKQSEQLTSWYMVHFPSHGSVWSAQTLVAFYVHDTSVFLAHLEYSLCGRFGKMPHPIKIFVCYVCADIKKLAPYVKSFKKLIFGGPFEQARGQNRILGGKKKFGRAKNFFGGKVTYLGTKCMKFC